jgi:diaminopimelate epimerase
MRVPFTKMQGLGNDFVLLDERAAPLGLDAEQLRRLADRRYGVGCDQVLLIDRPSLAGASVRYRVFNADGSAAQHCGNGVRCVASYLAAHNAVRGNELRVEIAGSTYELKLADDGNVTVDMGEPDFEPAALPMNVATRAPRYSVRHAGRDWAFGAVSMGNPHAVFPVTDLDHAPVAELGSRLQDDPLFPQRVNVGFMQVVDGGRIRLRVFERGAGETPACGTGACGAVAVGRLWGELSSRVVVELTGGELVIEWDGPGSRLWMRGSAVTVFEGTIEL